MSDQGEGVTTTEPESESAAPEDQSAEFESKLKQARSDAIEERKKRQAESKAREALEAQLNDLKQKVSKLTGEDSESEKPVTQDTSAIEKAENAIKRAAFRAEAISQGIDPALAADAAKLADLSGVVADLDAETAVGVEDAVAAFKDSRPQFFPTGNQQQTTSSVNTRPAGSTRGAHTDFNKAQSRSELKQMIASNPEAWETFRSGNKTTTLAGPNGQGVRATITSRPGGAFLDRVMAAKKTVHGD